MPKVIVKKSENFLQNDSVVKLHLKEVQDFLDAHKCNPQYFKNHLEYLLDIGFANNWGYACYFLEKAIECLDCVDS